MKKLWTMAMAVVFMFGMMGLAQAESDTITFDEDVIVYVPYPDSPTMVTTQYKELLGLTWSDSYSNGVVMGDDGTFNQSFDIGLDNPIIYYNSKNPAAGRIQLDSLADALSFRFRRAASPGNIYLELYDTTNAGALVHDFGRIGWDGPDWETFTYDGSFGNFDEIYIYCSNKFSMDDITVNFVKSTGACRLADESCTEVTENACLLTGGTYEGDGTDCDSVTSNPNPNDGDDGEIENSNAGDTGGNDPNDGGSDGGNSDDDDDSDACFISSIY